MFNSFKNIFLFPNFVILPKSVDNILGQNDIHSYQLIIFHIRDTRLIHYIYVYTHVGYRLSNTLLFLQTERSAFHRTSYYLSDLMYIL